MLWSGVTVSHEKHPDFILLMCKAAAKPPKAVKIDTIIAAIAVASGI
jgi:hypothetical protein